MCNISFASDTRGIVIVYIWDVNSAVFDIFVEVYLDFITLAQMLIFNLQMSFISSSV